MANEIQKSNSAAQNKVPTNNSVYNYLENLPANEREFGKEFRFFLGGVLKQTGVMLNRAFIKATNRIPLAGYNGVNAQELDKRMAKINWNKDYYSESAITKSADRPRMERDIMRVNRILADLKKLSDSGDHRAEELRWKLQHRHWTGTKMQGQRRNTTQDVTPLSNHPLKSLSTGQSSVPQTGQSQQPEKTASPENQISQGSRSQRRGTSVTTNEASQNRQASDVRRARVAFGAGRMGPSYSPRQRKPVRRIGH
jgi:hypothetical protein